MINKIDNDVYQIDNVLDKNTLDNLQKYIYNCNWQFGQTNSVLEGQKDTLDRNAGLLANDVERAWYRVIDNNAPIHFWRHDVFEDYDYSPDGGTSSGAFANWKSSEEYISEYKNFININNSFREISDGIIKDYEPTLIYLNGQTSGQCGGIHQDNNLPVGTEYSVLFFPMEWKINWGGQLILYNSNHSDTSHIIHPKKNRLIIFDGSIYHQGTSPNLNTNRMRTSLSYKMNKR